jgi:hypothetical protein
MHRRQEARVANTCFGCNVGRYTTERITPFRPARDGRPAQRCNSENLIGSDGTL